MDGYTDEQLVRKYLDSHDERVLEELVRRTMPLVYSISRRYTGNGDTAADITQETFVKVWKHLKRFDDARNFRAWISTIAKRTALDWLKQKQATTFSALDAEASEGRFADTIADDARSFLDDIIAAQDGARVKSVLAQMAPAYATVIGLYTEQGLTFRQISERLHEPLNTVKSRYRRGIERLRELLSDSAPKPRRSS
jgi:RNA polymerase sigma-70 factor (ECF subfamily)